MKHFNHLRKPIVAVALVGALAVGTAAATAYQTITASLRPDITVELNGTPQTMKDVNGNEVYAISYNGTTYLPIRAIGEAMGLTVNWDSATQTVDLVGSAAGSTTGVYISGDRAKEIALNDAGYTESQVVMVGVELEWDNGRLVYDVEFYVNKTEYDYEIDAAAGTIVEKDQDIENFTIPTTGVNITLNRAKEIALADAGEQESEVTFTKTKQDYENGRVVYEVEFYAGQTKYEYEIAASDGAILDKDVDAPTTGSGTGATAGITLDRAKEIALADAGVNAANATFTKAKQDYDNGRLIYELEFYCQNQNCEWEYDILAADGTILSREHDGFCDGTCTGSGNHYTGSNGHHYGNGSGSASITASEAKNIAFQHAGVSSGAVWDLEAKLDYDDGRLEYEVEFKANGVEYEYKIDANSGAILDFEWD